MSRNYRMNDNFRIFSLCQIGVCSLFLTIYTPAFGASFDCSKASSVIENTICNSPLLSHLDDQLGVKYKAIRAKLKPKESRTLKSEQIRWLKDRNRQCQEIFDTSDPNVEEKNTVECLAKSISKRLVSLGKQTKEYSSKTDRNGSSSIEVDHSENTLKKNVGSEITEQITNTANQVPAELQSETNLCRTKLRRSKKVHLTSWSGECPKGYADGNGILKWSDGTLYSGDVKDGRFHGRGLLTLPDGEVYDGEFKNNSKSGTGKQTLSNGEVYEGGFKSGRRHGYGVVILQNKDKFIGKYRSGKKHGSGTYVEFETGQLFLIEHTNDKEKAKVKITDDVAKYSIASRLETGPKTLVPAYNKHLTYIGEFTNQIPNGSGAMTWENGDSYEGQFNLGRLDGKGKYVWADGSTFIGEFEDGKLHGKGVEILTSGVRYEGYYNEGLRDRSGNVSAIELSAEGKSIYGPTRKVSYKHGVVFRHFGESLTHELRIRFGKMNESIQQKNNVQLIEYLESGLDPNAIGIAGFPRPLFSAIRADNVFAVTALVEFGANPNVPDEKGRLPLEVAVELNNIEAVAELLVLGADPNIYGKFEGELALSIAVKQEFNSIIPVLLRNGASPKSRNRDGKTPTTIARKVGNSIALELFEQYGYAYIKRNHIQNNKKSYGPSSTEPGMN